MNRREIVSSCVKAWPLLAVSMFLAAPSPANAAKPWHAPMRLVRALGTAVALTACTMGPPPSVAGKTPLCSDRHTVLGVDRVKGAVATVHTHAALAGLGDRLTTRARETAAGAMPSPRSRGPDNQTWTPNSPLFGRHTILADGQPVAAIDLSPIHSLRSIGSGPSGPTIPTAGPAEGAFISVHLLQPDATAVDVAHVLAARLGESSACARQLRQP